MHTRRATSRACSDGNVTARGGGEDERKDNNEEEQDGTYEDASESLGSDSDDSDFTILPDPNERFKVGLKVKHILHGTGEIVALGKGTLHGARKLRVEFRIVGGSAKRLWIGMDSVVEVCAATTGHKGVSQSRREGRGRE